MTDDVFPHLPALPFNEEAFVDPVTLNPLRRITQTHFVVMGHLRPDLSTNLRIGLERYLNDACNRPAIFGDALVLTGGSSSQNVLLIVEKEEADIPALEEPVAPVLMKSLMNDEKGKAEKRAKGGDYAAILEWMQAYSLDGSKIKSPEDIKNKSVITDVQVFFDQEAWKIARQAGYTIAALTSDQSRYEEALAIQKAQMPDNPYNAVFRSGASYS